MADEGGEARYVAFICANTRRLRPPLVPEIELHLAEESLPIWQKTEEELGEMNVPPPFWAFAWAGGQALARYVLDHPGLVDGRSVLDIGTGSGLVAIAAGLAGAVEVVANDVDRFAAAACRLNAAANGVTLQISRADLIGGGAALDEAASWPDVIFLADVFYEEDLAGDAMVFSWNAQAAGARVLVGDPRRSFFPQERFQKCAEYAVPVTRELEDSEIKNTAVWELARP